MSASNIIIARPISQDKFESLKAFLKALKINFEVANEETYNDVFVLSDKQVQLLDKRSKTSLEKCLPADDSLKLLRKKHGL